MSQSDQLKPARKSRTTIRFTGEELAIIQTIAGEQGVTTSEAARRLIFWARTPDYSKHLSALMQHWFG
jgi:hypothetical protein